MSTQARIGTLALFRILFGLCLVGHIVWSYFPTVLRDEFAGPSFHFKFFLFDWVPVPPLMALYALALVALAGAVFLTLGRAVRLAAAVVGTILTWFLLMDSTQFQNHYYFICLLCWLHCLLPPDREDSWILKTYRAQFALVYLFGGIAKLNPDWMSGKAMTMALSALTLESLVPDVLKAPFFVFLFSWGGLFFDLLIIPLLLIKRTRMVGTVALCLFHLTNLALWGLGIFPWLMLFGTWILFCRDNDTRPRPNIAPHCTMRIALCLWFAVQIALPLRQYLYEGPTRWHQQGDYFSWSMKLNHYAHFTELDVRPEGQDFMKIRLSDYLSASQRRTLHDPDHILQLAHHVRTRLNEQGTMVHAVRARSSIALNGGQFAVLVAPDANLLESKRQFSPHRWVLPFKKQNWPP